MAASAINKNLSKLGYCSKCHLFRHYHVALDRFSPLPNVYFNDVQTDRWPDLSTSHCEIPFRCNLFRKRVDQKNLLLWQQLTELIVLAVRLVCKIIFCSEFPDFPGKSPRWKKTNSKAIVNHDALQANAKNWVNNRERTWASNKKNHYHRYIQETVFLHF